MEESRPNCSLRLGTITESSGGAVVTLTIDNADDSSTEGLKQLKTELEAAAKQAIKLQRKALDERQRRLRLEGALEQLQDVYKEVLAGYVRLAEKPSLSIQSGGDVTMSGDNYKVGQGIAGKHVHAHDMTFNQIGGIIEQSMDLSELAGELMKLRQEMSQEAKETDHHIALGEVAKAEEAARAKDSSKVAESLKAAGKWPLDIATRIGASLAAEAIKHALGLP